MRQQLENSYSKHKHRYTQYVRDYIIRILEKKHQQVNGKKLLEQYINYPQIGHHFLAKTFHFACFEQMQGFCKVHYNA